MEHPFSFGKLLTKLYLSDYNLIPNCTDYKMRKHSSLVESECERIHVFLGSVVQTVFHQ